MMRGVTHHAPPLPAALAARGQEVEGLQEAQRSAQNQINTYIADLQVAPWQPEAFNCPGLLDPQ